MTTLEKYNELHKQGLIEHQDMCKMLGYKDETTFWAYRNNKRNVKLPAKKSKLFDKIVNKLYSKMTEFKTMIEDK